MNNPSWVEIGSVGPTTEAETLRAERYAQVVAKIVGGKKAAANLFPQAIEVTDGFSGDSLARLTPDA